MKLIHLKKIVLFFFLQIIIVFSISAQTKDELEQQAYDLLNEEEYQAAYSAFDALVAKYPKEIDYKQKLGICSTSILSFIHFYSLFGKKNL